MNSLFCVFCWMRGQELPEDIRLRIPAVLVMGGMSVCDNSLHQQAALEGSVRGGIALIENTLTQVTASQAGPSGDQIHTGAGAPRRVNEPAPPEEQDPHDWTHVKTRSYENGDGPERAREEYFDKKDVSVDDTESGHWIQVNPVSEGCRCYPEEDGPGGPYIEVVCSCGAKLRANLESIGPEELVEIREAHRHFWSSH